MKATIAFAAVCSAIVIWHLPTAVDCVARSFAGSYTTTEGGAEPAPTSSRRVRKESVAESSGTSATSAVLPRRAVEVRVNGTRDGARSAVSSAASERLETPLVAAVPQ